MTPLTNKKGNAEFVKVATAFGISIVGLVIAVILLQSMQTTTACPANFVYNATSNVCHQGTNVSNQSGMTYAGNITTDGITFMDNFSSQWGLAGTILGYTLVLAILALVGVGGYMAWQKFGGSR